MGRENGKFGCLRQWNILQFETKNQVQLKYISNLQWSLQVLDFLSEQWYFISE